FCAALATKGSPMSNVFGFIDGTKIQTSRIDSTGDGNNLQKQIYSGHKRMHCLNYQACRRHDSTMLRQSKLLQFFDKHRDMFSSTCIYGDPVYGIFEYLLSGYKGNNVGELKREFNKRMSRVRQSVEWNFKILKKN
ncbi:hypothetical protein H310_15032, partial [Aphanomyces invadans]